MPRCFFLISETVPWHSAARCVCENSGPDFPIADTFQEPVSNLAGRNPAQVGRKFCPPGMGVGHCSSRCLQVDVAVAGTEQMHLGFGKDHELTRFVRVREQ